MRNPFRSEAEAFRFLLATIVAFAAIAVAALVGGTWYGVGVAILVGAVALWWLLRSEPVEPVVTAPQRPHAPDEKRILVVANETVGGRTLREQVEQSVGDQRAEVLVVSPALNAPLRHWTSDEDAARDDAKKRLDQSLSRLRKQGISARGEVGDADPLQAIEDALRTFGADEIIISTHPEGRSNWLERGVVTGARERFAVHITHVVVDLDAEREDVQQG
jgi:hypothetical protein